MTFRLGASVGGVRLFTGNPTSFLVPLLGLWAHLSPAFTLPRDENGVAFTYSTATAETLGTVYQTDWISRAYLLANAAVVKTVKASGGDYLPSQLTQALADAAAANVLTVIVVDSGTTITATHTLAVKTGTPAHTFVVPSAWWSGAWAPSGNRYLDVDTEAANLYTLRAPATNNARVIVADGAGRDRVHFIGAKIERSNSAAVTASVLVEIKNDAATSVDQLPKEHTFSWCWIDGVWKNGATFYETRRGIGPDGYKCAVLHSVLTGFAGTGSDSQAVCVFTGGGRLKVRWSLLEAASENVMIGGVEPNANFLPEDIEIRQNYFPKRQDWNPSSSLWAPGGPSPIVKNCFELKHGRRVLVEGNVFENCYAQAQDGKGLSLKVSGNWLSYPTEAKPTRLVTTQDVTVRLNYFRNTGTAVTLLGSEEVSAAAWAAGSAPLGRVDIHGNVFEMGVRAQMNNAAYLGLFVLDGADAAPDPLARGMGALRIRNNTWVHREPATVGTLALLQNIPFDVAASITDNVFDAGFEFGVRIDGGATSAASLVAANAVAARNAWVPGTWLARADFATPFPAQHAPADLWPANRAAFGFIDHTARNYRLSPGSLLVGLGEGGTDPGAAVELLDTVTAGVRGAAPSFLRVEYI